MKIHDVEQRSEAWYRLRAGKPTASEFSKIVTSTGDPSKSASGYAITLAVELFAGKPLDAWEGNNWTERGREMEDEAIRLYEFANDTAVEKIGFVTNDMETMGCSPDGFVGDKGLVEIKALKAENHAKTIIYYQKNGKCPPDYIQQTQGQLMICGRQWADLVFYHPELPLLVIRQTPIFALVASLTSAIPEVMKERDVVLAALKRQAAPVTNEVNPLG